jgi:hypothetical protein
MIRPMKVDGRKLSHAQLEEVRFKAVKAVQAGQSPTAVARELCGNLGDAARSGGVVYRRFEDLDAVFESDTCDNLRQVICAFQPPPGF